MRLNTKADFHPCLTGGSCSLLTLPDINVISMLNEAAIASVTSFNTTCSKDLNYLILDVISLGNLYWTLMNILHLFLNFYISHAVAVLYLNSSDVIFSVYFL